MIINVIRKEPDRKISDLMMILGCQFFFKIWKQKNPRPVVLISLFPYSVDPVCYQSLALKAILRPQINTYGFSLKLFFLGGDYFAFLTEDMGVASCQVCLCNKCFVCEYLILRKEEMGVLRCHIDFSVEYIALRKQA